MTTYKIITWGLIVFGAVLLVDVNYQIAVGVMAMGNGLCYLYSKNYDTH